MDIKSIALGIRAVAVVAFLAGCSAMSLAPEAYVHRPYAINRDDENFPNGPELEEYDEVTICYAKAATTPGAIKKLADEECSRFGMSAKFDETDFAICPLLTPSAAKFVCRLPEGQSAVRPTESRSSTLFRGSSERPVVGSTLPRSFSGIGAADVSTSAKSAPYPTYLFDGKQKRP